VIQYTTDFFKLLPNFKEQLSDIINPTEQKEMDNCKVNKKNT